ncbi:DUF1007 family protein [Salaquimonas pukyongi]|uniref:DUF1007 family protein n=1 Tax=Salaquimonas pukyongi TaxID=2712698 RepID=UPI00096BC394|nr:DUF1007 family protein [Salaquimonas pukyongi]
MSTPLLQQTGPLTVRSTLIAGLAASLLLSSGMPGAAHPHVWIEANLEVVRNEKGEATEIRHVWRFDEIFSSSLVLDFDDNGNGELDPEELETIGKETRISLAEYNFYTEIRSGSKVIDFFEPEPYIVDYKNGQLMMIMAMELTEPQPMGAEGFKVAVSDPTYYVAVELPDPTAVIVSGNGKSCTSQIVVPDWDALYARDADRLADLFTAGPDEKIDASEDYLTWVEFSCPA